MDKLIQADALTSFDVSADGETVRFNVQLRQGSEGAIELPAEAVGHLLMNLPGVIEQALRRSHRNDDLRLVHGLEAFRLEHGEPDENGVPRHVLTLRTHGGYEVPFALTGSELGAIAQAIIDQALADGAVLEPLTLDA